MQTSLHIANKHKIMRPVCATRPWRRRGSSEAPLAGPIRPEPCLLIRGRGSGLQSNPVIEKGAGVPGPWPAM
jgi:hypothetical protein